MSEPTRGVEGARPGAPAASVSPSGTRFRRAGGFGALGFAAVIFGVNALALVPAGMPTTGAVNEEVDSFFTGEGAAVGIASVLLPAAWVMSCLFAAAVVAATWTSERSRKEAWSLAGLAGIVLQNAVFTVVSALRLGLAESAHQGVGSNDIAGWWAFHEALFVLNGTFLALALVGLTVAGSRAGLVRTWLAVTGFAAAVLQFASASLTPVVMAYGEGWGLIGLVGWLLWVVWLVGYGIALIRSRPDAALLREPAGEGSIR